MSMCSYHEMTRGRPDPDCAKCNLLREYDNDGS